MKKTKLFKLALIAGAFVFAVDTQAQIETPRPSPAGSTSTTVGLTDIDINYFRPQTKGRKIFGAGDDVLIPFGQLWRAGANSGTKISFSDDVKIAGKDLAAGEYLFLATPGASEWSVVFYSDLSLGGNVGKFDASKAVLTVSAKSTKLTESVSTLTFNITDISEDSKTANIQLAWENTAVNIPIEVSFDKAVMSSIEKNTKVDPRNLMTAARYYYEADKDLDQALVWVNSYLSQGENSKQFWNVLLKAQILAKKGDKKSAITTAKAGMATAKANPDGDYGYVKRYEAFISETK